MMTRYFPVVLLSGAIAFAGCSELNRPNREATSTSGRAVVADDPDILALSVFSVPLENSVAISETDYLARIAEDAFAAGNEKTRDLQVQMAARSNAQSALGLIGTRETVTLDGKLILVVQNPRKLADGREQATGFSVVNGELFGEAQGLVGLELHFASKEDDPCARPFRGCSVLTAPDLRPSAFANWDQGGMGLPPETRIDAESAERPANFTGHTIELWNLPNQDVRKLLWPDFGFVGNRFACAEPMDEASSRKCDEASQGDAPGASSTPETKLGERVLMVAESDFQAAFLGGQLSEFVPGEEQTIQAATIATSLNFNSVADVSADFAKMESVEADVLLVAKSPRLGEQTLTARRVFVVPGPIKISTPSGLVGVGPTIHGLDSSFFSMGFCGPVLFPSLGLEPGSPGVPKSLSMVQGAYGSDRQANGLPRSTMHVPIMHQGRQSLQILACSQLEPPIPPPPLVTPMFKTENCNGIDDTGDGRVDEDACSLNYCSGCIPVTSCGGRCMSAPDGCGGVLACSCP